MTVIRLRATSTLTSMTAATLAGLSLLLAAIPLYAEDPGNERNLVPEERHEGELAVGDLHAWHFEAGYDEYVELETEFLTTEIGLRVFKPGEDSPYLTRFPEQYAGGMGVRLITDKAGTWRVDVSPARVGLSGKYAVTLSQPRTPNEEDRLLTQTGAWLYEGMEDIRNGLYPEGEAKLYDALNTREQHLGRNHLEVAGVYGAIADHYYGRGRYAEALEMLSTAADIEQAVTGSVGLTSLNNMGTVADSAGDHLMAIDYLERSVAERTAQLGAEHPRVGISLDNLGLLYERLGRFVEAEELYLRAKGIFETSLGPDHYYVSWPLGFLAGIYERQGRIEEAEDYYRRAIEMREERTGPSSSLTLVARNNFARFLLEQGRNEEAEEIFEAVLRGRIELHGEIHPEVSHSYIDVGQMAISLGKYDEAVEAFRNARRVYRQVDPEHWLNLDNQYWVAYAEYRQGENSLDDLIADLERIEEGLLAHEHNFGALERIRSRLARSLYESGDLDAAVFKMQQAIDMLEERRHLAASDEADRASANQAYRPRYNDVVAWLYEMGEFEDAYLYSERARSRVMLDQLEAGNIDVRAGIEDAGLRDRLAQQEKQARMHMAETRARLNAVRSDTVMPAERREASKTALQSELDEAQRAYRDVYREIRTASSVVSNLVTSAGSMVSSRELARSLERNTAALSFYVGDKRSFVFLVQPNKRMVASEIMMRVDNEPRPVNGEALSTLVAGYSAFAVDTLQRGLVTESTTGSRPAGPDANLREVIIPDELWAIVRDYENVLILPDGPLASLPFEAIVVEKDQDDARYWLDVGPSVSYASSGTVFANLKRRKAPSPLSRSLDVLTVYDPLFDVGEVTAALSEEGSEENPAVVNVAMLTRSTYENSGGGLQRLPGTALEGRALMDAFADHQGTEIVNLYGVDATERNTRAAIAKKRFVHLGTHGLTDESRGSLFAALALTPPADDSELGIDNDGFLELHEIYDLPLSGVELAVLSACETNVGSEVQGEGGFTLARGFLAAGARRVISSHWAVNDEATAVLIGAFFTELAEHDRTGRKPDYAQILSNAKKHLRGTERWSDPYYWAPFVLSGVP